MLFLQSCLILFDVFLVILIFCGIIVFIPLTLVAIGVLFIIYMSIILIGEINEKIIRL